MLRTYGNMSSATLLFILRDQLADDAVADGRTIGTLAFGPGLTVESALLRARVPAPVHAETLATVGTGFAE